MQINILEDILSSAGPVGPSNEIRYAKINPNANYQKYRNRYGVEPTILFNIPISGTYVPPLNPNLNELQPTIARSTSDQPRTGDISIPESPLRPSSLPGNIFIPVSPMKVRVPFSPNRMNLVIPKVPKKQ